MLTRIDVVSENAFYIPILGVTPKDSLLIKKITGLNPPDRSIFIGDYARDGGIYQGNRVGLRNVVITMELNPNPALGETVSGLRDMLYKAFMDPLPDAEHLQLLLKNDLNEEFYIVGYVEKFETDIFDVETLAQISIICPDPFIRNNQETVLLSPSGWVTVPFIYKGTAETGFQAEIKVTTASNTLTLENNGKKMIMNYAFLPDDIVKINTTRGNRDVTLTRDSVTSPLVATLTTTSPWLELHSQANVMKTYGAAVDDIVASVIRLAYTAAYWGI